MIGGLHKWRWRFMTVWIIIFTIIVAVSLQMQHSQANQAKDIASEAKKQNSNQQATIKMLCDRGYLMDNLLQVITPNSAYQRRDLLQLHNELIAQLTDKESPCVIIGH